MIAHFMDTLKNECMACNRKISSFPLLIFNKVNIAQYLTSVIIVRSKKFPLWFPLVNDIFKNLSAFPLMLTSMVPLLADVFRHT